MSHFVVEVVIDAPGLFLDKRFDYLLPRALASNARPGVRVVVPFRSAWKAGVIWRVRSEADVSSRVRTVASVVDEEPVLTEEQLRLAEWLCERYAATLPEALSAILPGAFRVTGGLQLQPARGVDVPDDVRASSTWQFVAQKKPDDRAVAKLDSAAKEQIEAWVELGYLERVLHVSEQVQARLQSFLSATKEPAELLQAAAARETRAPRQAALLRQLAVSGELAWARKEYARTTVQPLVEAGLVRVDERAVSRFIWPDREERPAPALTVHQARATARLAQLIQAPGAHMAVVHGVTGSGKTEVYMRAIDEVVRQGRQAVLLVPEIALTPQMVGRFYSRFGDRIAVLHSALAQGERRDEWARILRGDASIVIGARSAVFAPVRNLGLVIVDEEHEPSYKQEDAPHYDAREIAVRRAETADALVVFGSATPSLWAIRQVEDGRATLVSLPQRANGKPLPKVEIVDMREELRAGNKSLFSERLQQELEATVRSGLQAILFLNRRGYASSTLCRACGEGVQCPHCDIHLTVHRADGGMRLVCHYCGYEQSYSDCCPACGERALRAFGIGTEQIESAIATLWPDFRVLRMDVDTTRKKGALQQIVADFEAGRADVLIGTQMIAKGLDFPRVRLVGVVAADTMLTLPDYRAHERTFQLLTQVAGRAGRAETDGVTLIQTYRPEHFAIQAAAAHDFVTFYREERSQRAFFTYPPFCELAVFLASHPAEHVARGAAMRFERELRRSGAIDYMTLLPASPSGIRRIDNLYRYQVVLKYGRWEDVGQDVTQSYRVVKERMNRLGGSCRLDVNAQRIG
ncbi:primosomal protein N' [Alicyclobacillus hesperidum subsp. aegles]|uniref:primosomal protein N' n=1 Tax=Alicyclobacillus hesperidum TaxID=89784 RepID=UPI002229DC4B|nr:primosomal protein N' [Alicyclobacillus hesperidum]GLG01073.1 primosomal protein N' [Alicyclobacillus hesperidum subsp. aegles]